MLESFIHESPEGVIGMSMRQVVFSVESWNAKDVIPRIVEYLKSHGFHGCVVIKGKVLTAVIEDREKCQNREVAFFVQWLKEIQEENNAGILPYDATGKLESFVNFKIIATKKVPMPEDEELGDCFRVYDTGVVEAY